MLTRINDIHKLHEVVQFHVVLKATPVEITPVINNNGITLEYRVNGELIAEERKITPAMAEQVWHVRYKSDHVWVDDKRFREFAGSVHWSSLTTAEKWIEYRHYNYKMMEVRDERTFV